MEHQSYSLGIWYRRTDTGLDWRCRLAHLQSGTKLRFSSRQALIEYLQTSLPSDISETEEHRASEDTPTPERPV